MEKAFNPFFKPSKSEENKVKSVTSLEEYFGPDKDNPELSMAQFLEFAVKNKETFDEKIKTGRGGKQGIQSKAKGGI